MAASETFDREIVSTRVFDAPRALVWRAWSEPQHLINWWGPKGFTNTFASFAFEPGGVWRFVMHGPDRADYKNEIVFAEIFRPERIVFDHVSPPRFRVTVRFEALGNKTRVTFRQVFETASVYDRLKSIAIPGNEQNFDRLAAWLGGMADEWREVTIRRRFAAPRALVWQAWTDPQHLARWWGPDGFTNPVCEVDARVGGAMRIVMRAPDGSEYPLRAVFHEIVPLERLVFSNIAVDADGLDLIDGQTTVSFVEQEGGTSVTVQSWAVALVPQAVPMMAGMQAGWTQSIDRLAAQF